MTALGTPDQAPGRFRANGQDSIDPGASGINNSLDRDFLVIAISIPEADRTHGTVGNRETGDLTVRFDLRACRPRCKEILQHEALRESDLGVVITGGCAQSLRLEARLSPMNL